MNNLLPVHVSGQEIGNQIIGFTQFYKQPYYIFSLGAPFDWVVARVCGLNIRIRQ